MTSRGFVASVIATSLLFVTPSLACSLSDVGPDNFWAATDVMPRMLYGQAEYVEVVEVLSAEPYLFAAADAPDAIARVESEQGEAAHNEAQRKLEAWIKRKNSTGVTRVTFRVVERLKGEGPESFTLTALHHDRTTDRVSRQNKSIAGRGDFSDPLTIFAIDMVEAREWGGGGTCRTPLETMAGQRYLVFRGKDGRLITGKVPAAIGWSLEETYLAGGPVFEPIAGDNDPWLLRVREAKEIEVRALQALKARIEAGENQ